MAAGVTSTVVPVAGATTVSGAAVKATEAPNAARREARRRAARIGRPATRMKAPVNTARGMSKPSDVARWNAQK